MARSRRAGRGHTHVAGRRVAEPHSLRTRRGAEALAKALARPWLAAVLVFVLALAVRVLHVAQLAGAPFFAHLVGDSVSYDAWAQGLAQGDWLRRGTGVFYQAPLYPYALGLAYELFGRDLLFVRLAQAVIGALSCAFLTAAGMKWFGRSAGLASGLFFAGYAPAMFFDGLIQKSVLDGMLVAALLLALGALRRESRAANWGVVGAVLGLLALNRENTIALAPVVIALALTRAKARASAALVLVAAMAVVMAPVGVRNWAVGGEFHLTTFQLGSNFYIGNHAGASGTYVPLQRGHGNFTAERQDAVALAERAEGRELRPSEVSSYWLDRGLEWIRSDPGAYFRLTIRKLLLLLNATEAADSEDLMTHAEWSVPLRVSGWLLHFGVLAPLALLGAWITRSRWRELWPLYLLAAVSAASVLCFYVLDRYRYPLVPLFVLFAGAAVTEVTSHWKHHGPGERAKTVVACTAALVLCNWPLLSTTDMQAVTHYNTGVALEEGHLADQAEAEYRAALALQPRLSEAHSNLGAILSRKGNQTEGLLHCAEAVRLDPGSATARVNLGTVLGSLGRVDEAVEAFNRALQLDPRNADAHYDLAKVLMALGRPQLAAEHLRETIRVEPSRSDAHTNLGILLCSEGHLAEGIEHLKTAVALAPDSVEARANLEHALELTRRQP